MKKKKPKKKKKDAEWLEGYDSGYEDGKYDAYWILKDIIDKKIGL